MEKMYSRITWAKLLPPLLGFILNASVHADNLYRWIDADGQVHLSDRAPSADAAATVERLARPSYADPGLPIGYYALGQQLQRLQTERLTRQREQRAREREARELALREREVQAAERIAEQAMAPRSGGTPVWLAPKRPPRTFWPDHRRHPTPYTGLWRPDHPAYRPPPRFRHGPETRQPSMRIGL